MGRRAVYSVLPGLLAGFLAGCGGDVARPSPADSVNAALSRGESGYLSLLSDRPCEELDDLKGLLKITGVSGAAATLELSCGGVVYERCTAAVAPGASGATCETEERSPVGSGIFGCSQRVERGNPSVAATCYPAD